MPMAMGAVTDFGATEATSGCPPPNSFAISTALTTPVVVPAASVTAIAGRLRRMAERWRRMGTAKATVAGPSRKWTNFAPSK